MSVTRTWDEEEAACLATYGGGHRTDGHLEAFQHGMSTIFNTLRAHYPSRQMCKAAPDLLAACEMFLAFMSNVNAYEPIDVVATVIKAMKKAGCPELVLDNAAIAMLRGACSLPSGEPIPTAPPR